MFLTAFSIVFLLLNTIAFIFIRALLPRGRKTTFLTLSFFIIMFLSFIIRRLYHSQPSNILFNFFLIASSFYVVVILYLAISGVITETIITCYKKSGSRSHTGTLRLRKIISYICISLSAAVIIAGYINTLSPAIVHYNIEIPKKSIMHSLRLAVISDIHAGDIARNKNISVLADKLNTLKPDCILIAGDLFDHSVDSVIAGDVLRPLASVHSKFGTFVAFGNHDYFDNGDKAQQYAETLNFTILRDRTVFIGGSFYITGREDFSVTRRTVKGRTPLAGLLTGVNRDYPIILIDHQPNTLRDAVENNVDLQVSGHTHNGQFWPVHFITDLIYELPYGHRRISSTDFIVTSGAGTWGPPVRTTGRSEIVCVDITFSKE